MTFTGNENQEITLTEGAAMTGNYRNTAGTNPVLAHYFGKKILTDILAQEECVGIRFYYAATAGGEKRLVIVGTDRHGNDFVNGIIGDKSYACPPTCGNANVLNS